MIAENYSVNKNNVIYPFYTIYFPMTGSPTLVAKLYVVNKSKY